LFLSFRFGLVYQRGDDFAEGFLVNVSNGETREIPIAVTEKVIASQKDLAVILDPKEFRGRGLPGKDQ
jgi:hypothetical protein